MKKRHIPNILSTVRILMVPLFMFLFLNEYPKNILPAMLVFVTAGATDVVDGYIARKFNWSTRLGRLLDPLADKLLQGSAFICLSIVGLIPIWMTAAYFAKEVLLAIGAAVIFKRERVVVKSNLYGKLATVIVFCAVFVITLFGKYMMPEIINIICGLVLAYIIIAFIIYFIENYKVNFKLSNTAKTKTKGNT